MTGSGSSTWMYVLADAGLNCHHDRVSARSGSPSCWRLATTVAILALALGWCVQPVAADADRSQRHPAAAPYDINGDGFGDLVVDDGFATVSGKEWAGALRIAFGSSTGLTGKVQKVTQASPGIKGRVRPGRQFGQGVISADFDVDGYADIAGQDYGGIQVVYGSRSGLSGRDQRFSMERRLPVFGLFGPVMASGDFDADGFADLVVSSPGSEDIKGALIVLRGSARGLTIRGALRVSRDTPGVPGKGFFDDFFGAGLAVGDVDGDGIDDLALSSDEEETNGSLYIFTGSAKGLQIKNHTYFLADAVFGHQGLRVSNDSALTIGDLNHDGFGDLAVGSPQNCPPDEELDSCGAVGILPGSASGLKLTGSYVWDQDTPSIPGQVRSTDRFASTIAAGDLDHDGFDDLAISAPGMRVGRASGAGAVVVVYGGRDRLDFARSQLWSQGTRRIKGIPVTGDNFGLDDLRIADIGRGARPDLIVLTSYDRERSGRKARTYQSTNVLFSGRIGVTTSDQRWSFPQSDGS
jgi:hypothetical protein